MADPITGQSSEIESLVYIQNRGKYASGGIAFFTIGCILSSVSWFVFDASDDRYCNHDLQFLNHGTEMGTSDLPLLMYKAITAADVSDEMLKRVQGLVTTDTALTDDLYDSCVFTASSGTAQSFTYKLGCADEYPDDEADQEGLLGLVPRSNNKGFHGIGWNLDPARNGDPNKCPLLSSSSFFKTGDEYEDGSDINTKEKYKRLVMQAIMVNLNPTPIDKDKGDPAGVGKTFKYCAKKGDTCKIKPSDFGTGADSLKSTIMMCSTKRTMFESQLDDSGRNLADVQSGLNEGEEHCLQWQWTGTDWVIRFPSAPTDTDWAQWMPDLEKRASTEYFKCELSTKPSDLCTKDKTPDANGACAQPDPQFEADDQAANAEAIKAFEFVHDVYQDGDVACWALSPTYYEPSLLVHADVAAAGLPKIMSDDLREKIETYSQEIAPMLTNADSDDKAITPRMKCDDVVAFEGGCNWCDVNKEVQSRKSTLNAEATLAGFTAEFSFSVQNGDKGINGEGTYTGSNTVCKHPLKSLYNFTTTSYYDGKPIDGANYCIYYNLLHRVWTNVGNDPKKSIMMMNIFALVFGGFLLLWHGYLLWTKRDTVLGIHKSGLLPCLIHIAGVIIISVAVFTDVIAYASIACFGAEDWSMDTEAEDILMAVGLVFMGLGTAFLFYVSAVTKSHDAYLGNLKSSDYGRFLDFAITATIVGMASWQWVSLIHGHFHRVQEDSTGDCEDANDLTTAEQVFIWIIVIATTAVALTALLRLIESLMENPDVQRYGTYAKVEAISLVVGLVSLFLLLIILTVNGLQHPTCMTSAHQGNKLTGGRDDYDEANELFYIMIAQIVIVCTITIQPHFEKESGGSDTLTFES